MLTIIFLVFWWAVLGLVLVRVHMYYEAKARAYRKNQIVCIEWEAPLIRMSIIFGPFWIVLFVVAFFRGDFNTVEQKSPINWKKIFPDVVVSPKKRESRDN